MLFSQTADMHGVKPFHDGLITDMSRVVFSDSAYKSRKDFGNRYESLPVRRSELEKHLETVRSELGRINSGRLSHAAGTQKKSEQRRTKNGLLTI